MKNAFLTIFLIFFISTIYCQDISVIKINEYNDKVILEKKYNCVLENYSIVEDFSSILYEKDKTNIIVNFNAKIVSPNRDYYIAFFEGETISKNIGFFDKDNNLYNYCEVNVYPVVNFSHNGHNVVVFDIFSNKFYCFTKKGDLIYANTYENIVNNTSFYNAYIDDSGKYLVLNGSYVMTLIDLREKAVMWTINNNCRRIAACAFNADLEIIIVKGLLEKEELLKNNRYNISLFSIKKGVLKARINNVCEMFVINNNIIVKSQEKWQEYVVK